MLYEEKFKNMVAYICANKERTRVVKALERSGQPITTRYFMDNLWYDNQEEVISLLEGLEKRGIIECLSRVDGKCESWDLTSAGRDVLIAIENPVPTSGWFITDILRKVRNKLRDKLGNK